MIISYSGQRNKTERKVVKQPGFLLSNQKELEWWAEGGLVYCFNPNKEEKGRTYLQPLEALQRVATLIKLFVADCKEKPEDYAVKQGVMATFFNDFKTKVFDEALRQDEENGNAIRNFNRDYAEAKQEMRREIAIENAQAQEKKTKLFLPPGVER